MQTFLCGFEGFGREIYGRAVMSLQDEETNHHRTKRLAQQGVLTVKELLQGNEVIVALTHFLTRDRDHVIMHPVVYGLMTQSGTRLRNLRLMVREDQIQTTSVDIKLLTEVLRTHRGALHMPSRETFTPRTRPMHDMLRTRFLPKGKVVTVLFLLLTVQLTGLGHNIVEVSAAQLTIRIILRVFLYVHIHAAVRHIGIAFVQNLLHKSNLLNDMSARMRLNRRRQDIKGCHIAVVTVGIELNNLHRLQLLQTRFLSYLILAFIGVMLQVTHIGDITNITHFVAQKLKVAVQHIERDSRTGVTQMGIAIHRRTAYIHTDMSLMKGLECFLKSSNRVVNFQHIVNFFFSCD